LCAWCARRALAGVSGEERVRDAVSDPSALDHALDRVDVGAHEVRPVNVEAGLSGGLDHPQLGGCDDGAQLNWDLGQVGTQRFEEPRNMYAAQRGGRTGAESPAAQRAAQVRAHELADRLLGQATGQFHNEGSGQVELAADGEQRLERRAVPVAALQAAQRGVTNAAVGRSDAQRHALAPSGLAQRRP
jgi:hypothetical protein